MKSSVIAVFVVTALVPVVGQTSGLPSLLDATFCVTDIGRPPGATQQEAYPNPFSINNRNEIVGSATKDGITQAFIWTRETGMQMLGALPGTEISNATDINDFGRAVGDSFSQEVYFQLAFVWDRAGGMRPIDVGPNRTAIDSYGINVFGQIAGTARVEGENRAFLRQPNGRVIDLGPGGAAGLNDLGQVIGANEDGLFIWDRWRGHRKIEIPAELSGGLALDINNFGVVVGEVFGGPTRAFRWTQREGLQDLGSLASAGSPYDFTTAAEINDWGYVVGASQVDSGDSHAFIWHKRSGMHDLQAMLDASSPLAATTRVVIGKAINERGYIVADGFDTRESDAVRAYLLSPRFAGQPACE